MHNARRLGWDIRIYAPCIQSTRLLPLVTSDGAGTIHVSVYRKLRSGSVKSSALNGTGQTYAKTWEIAARALYTYPSGRKTYKTPPTP